MSYEDEFDEDHIINVGSKPPSAYVSYATRKLLRGHDIVLRGRGDAITQVFDTEQLLKRDFDEEDGIELETELLDTDSVTVTDEDEAGEEHERTVSQVAICVVNPEDEG